MTTTAIAAVHLLLLGIFGVSRYASTLYTVTSAFQLMTDREAESILAESPEHNKNAAIGVRQQPGKAESHGVVGEDGPVFCPNCRYKCSSQTCKKRLKYLQKKNVDKSEALRQIFREHPTHCRQRNIELASADLCFVTAEFSERSDDMDQLPTLEEDMITDPPRHYAFTNQATYRVPEGWTKIVLDESISQQYTRQITKSRWPKFMGWQHPTLRHCQVIFYGDAYLLNPINETNWMEMAKEIKQNPVGLMQDKQEGLRGDNRPIQELVKVAKEGKLSYELANKTIQWLENQSDYRSDASVYKNAIFGYDPSNSKVRKLMTDFWEIYAGEELSWRDQPIWAYLLAREEMRPLELHRKNGKLFGEFGERGHGGHVYVPEQKAEAEAEKRRIEEERLERQREDELVVVPPHDPSVIKYEACFVTSVFASSTDQADRVGDVSHLREANPNFQYFGFTNLHDLEMPGWEKIVQDNLPYQRFITQSRFAKFVSWKVDEVRENCGVVFYSDGHLIPKSSANATHLFRVEAMRIRESKYGLAQWKHQTLTTYKKLTSSIVMYRKDTKENVQRTMRQLASFDDFEESSTIIYWNQCLGYDPNNPYYVGLSQRFWDMYAKEYGTYRDQLLWSYVIASENIKPRKLKARRWLYDNDDRAMGFGGHIFVERKSKGGKKKKEKDDASIAKQ